MMKTMLPGKVRTAIICLWIELVSLILGLLLIAALVVLLQQLDFFRWQDLGPVEWMLVWAGVAVSVIFSMGMTIWHYFVIRGLQRGQSSAWLQGCIMFGIGILLQGSLITGILGLITLLDTEVKDFYQGKPATPRPGKPVEDDLWPDP